MHREGKGNQVDEKAQRSDMQSGYCGKPLESSCLNHLVPLPLALTSGSRSPGMTVKLI